MVVSLSEKIRREAGRLNASVDHSDFWRDAGYEPQESGKHRESELRQIARNIMTSEMLSEALERDLERFESFSSATQDNIELIKKEHRKALNRQEAERFARRKDETVHGTEGVKNRWLRAESREDFEELKHDFEKLVELERNYARKVIEAENRECEPYRVHFERFEPHISLEEVDRIFERLKDEVKQIVEQLDIPGDQPRLSDFRQLSDLVDDTDRLHDELVFELLQGDLDSILVKEGPYGMERGDALMAGMNVNSDQAWPKALDTTVHEFGHVDYRAYLPDRYVFTPIGEAASDTIDEACARLWQVHVAHSRPFIQQLVDKVSEHGVDADPEKVYRAVNAVDPGNKERISADQLTYQLHIIVRYEIERGLINGDIEVEELEDEWDRKMSELFPGYSSEVPLSEKFLQDPHWGKGKFGYFPTYALGSIAAAQIYRSAEKHIKDLDERIERGDYKTLSEWLEANLYRHGKRYTTQQLVRRASGRELDPEPFLNYARQKLGELYGHEEVEAKVKN